MHTKLLPRLIATGALAAGLSVAGAVSGLASAHAVDGSGPVVTKGVNGSIDVDLSITEVQSLRLSANVQYTCADIIYPDSSGAVAVPTCTAALTSAADTYWRQHIAVHVNFHKDGTYTISGVR